MKRLTAAATALAALVLSATTASAGSGQVYGSVTFNTAPAYTYTAPSYAVPTYTTPTYTAPAYIAPTYNYTAPAYVAPTYDATDRVRQRLKNQKRRINAALARGDLLPREENRLRNALRNARQTFRAYRNNDGVIGRYEEDQLMRMLNRNSNRIARLANNHRTVYSHGAGYGYGYSRY